MLQSRPVGQEVTPEVLLEQREVYRMGLKGLDRAARILPDPVEARAADVRPQVHNAPDGVASLPGVVVVLVDEDLTRGPIVFGRHLAHQDPLVALHANLERALEAQAAPATAGPAARAV